MHPNSIGQARRKAQELIKPRLAREKEIRAAQLLPATSSWESSSAACTVGTAG